jgi:hypothetical protein
MPPHMPSIFNHTKRWFSRNRSPQEAVCPDDNREERTNASKSLTAGFYIANLHQPIGFFTNAQDVTINGGQLKLTQTNHYVNNTISTGNAGTRLS